MVYGGWPESEDCRTGNGNGEGRLLPNLSNCVTRIDPAGPAPCGELQGVDPSVAYLGPVHHAVVHAELQRQRTLSQSSRVPHRPEHGAHLPIGILVLGPCCHSRSRLDLLASAASLAAHPPIPL